MIKLNDMNRSTLYTGKFLALIQEGHWEYARRTNATGAAIIAAAVASPIPLVPPVMRTRFP